ncbi:MAG TPA: hypothetical protein VI248_18765 [Kineosporiaceae bacterium]
MLPGRRAKGQVTPSRAGAVAVASPLLRAAPSRYARIATTPDGDGYRTASPGAPAGVPGDDQLTLAAWS